MELAFVIGFVVLTVLLDVAATHHIRKDDYLTAFQRKALIVFIWVIPIMGAMFVYSFRRDAKSAEVGDDGLSGFEAVDPEMPSLHDDASPGHGDD